MYAGAGIRNERPGNLFAYSTMQLLNIDNYYRVNYEGVIAMINMLTYAHNYKFSMCLLYYT